MCFAAFALHFAPVKKTPKKTYMQLKNRTKNVTGGVFKAVSIHINREVHFWCGYFYRTKNAASRILQNTAEPQLISVKRSIGFHGHEFFFCFFFFYRKSGRKTDQCESSLRHKNALD